MHHCLTVPGVHNRRLRICNSISHLIGDDAVVGVRCEWDFISSVKTACSIAMRSLVSPCAGRDS